MQLNCNLQFVTKKLQFLKIKNFVTKPFNNVFYSFTVFTVLKRKRLFYIDFLSNGNSLKVNIVC